MSSMFPNVLHNDKWQISFSNMPSMTNIQDMRLYDNYVRAVVIPDYNLEYANSDYLGFQVRHPINKANTDLSQITITFKASEDLMNYINIFEYMQSMKYGNEVNLNDENMFRKQVIHSIVISFLDNQKRVIANWSFTNSLITNLSSLPLEFGSASEVLFTVNFIPEEIGYESKLSDVFSSS